MKNLIKNSRKNSIYGLNHKRKLKLVISSMIILLVSASFCFLCGNDIGIITGALLATAPIAFVLPESLKSEMNQNEIKGIEFLAEYFNNQLEQREKGNISQDVVNDSIKSALELFVKENGVSKDNIEKIKKSLLDQGIEIKLLKESSEQHKKNYLKEKLKEFISSDELKSKIKGGVTSGIELKAAGTILESTNVTGIHGFSYEVVPGIHSSPYEGAILYNILSKGMTGSRTIIWINRKDKDGAAAFIAEGELKPLVDWTYEEENSTAKKIAVSCKVSTEMLEDFDYMEGEIRLLLEREIWDELNNKILLGDGTGANPNGITNVASAYTGTSLDGTIVLPNDVDVLRAAMLQERMLKYVPDVVFVNPGTAAEIDLTKTSDGHYLKIEMNGILRQLRIIESLEIPSGYFLMMDSSKWVIKTYKDFRLEFGWENDDLRKNLVLIIAEMRIHSYSSSIDSGAFIYDQFSVVKGALEKTSTTE